MPSAPDYKSENLRRKRAVDKENEFLKENFVDSHEEDSEEIPVANRQSQMERSLDKN